ncbi:unannotated protein [freshwater metagenome]|uniref:Unannotated protein n=1 Tax=freshwater metagenome TaxID=449393 RepID=A0A6J6GEX8_9ZZZZ
MGRATAMLFADEGARIMITDWDADALQGVESEIVAAHGKDRVESRAGSVADHSDRCAIIDQMVSRWGGVDILVNNAGISRISSVHSDIETFTLNWEETFEINVSAHAHFIRECLPYLLLAPQGGRVVNIASTEALVATGGLAAYTAAKHAVIGLTKSFAVELGRHNITVNAVCPGPIETGMTQGIPEEAKQKYARRKVPVRRYGQPEEVAHMTLSLCLPAASFVNGAALVVDGGMSIAHA